MKILFIENKYKTGLWSIIAKQLTKQGHSVEYLIQNPLFKGKYGKNHIIPFPKWNEKTWPLDGLEKIITADRNLNYFGGKNNNYFGYYFQRINELLSVIKPNLIIGESTLFHELLTIEASRRKNILYLNPGSSRYPSGRFSFYKYDTLEPAFGSKEILSNQEAISIINGIKNRSLVPDYMKNTFEKKGKMTIDKQKLKFKLINPLIMSFSYLIGEHFNTPSPFVKMRIEKRKKKSIKIWNKIAQKKKKINIEKRFVLLYPLQMQPEANIDVWGNKYRNQTELIIDIHKQLEDHEILVVKANPKSKYELSLDLLAYIEKSDNIYIPDIECLMEEILPYTDLIITVTGTISIEAPIMNIPAATLTRSYMNNFPSMCYLNSVSRLREIIISINLGTFKLLSEDEKISYLKHLNSISYKGLNGAPFLNEIFASDRNLKQLFSAYTHVVDSLKGDC